MATLFASSSSSSFLLLFVFVTFFAGAAYARPCKTILLSRHPFSAIFARRAADFPHSGAVHHDPSQVIVVFDSSRRAGPGLHRHSPLHTRRHKARDGTGGYFVPLTLALSAACGGLAAAAVYFVWVLIGAPWGDDEVEKGYEKVPVKEGYEKMPAEPVKEGYEVMK